MIKLSKRLMSCASLVREGSALADIGCDHGYVPVYLIKNNIIKGAVACDINEGPLDSCSRLVKAEGLDEKIKCVISDGLDGVDETEADDILIAGMGGELIADILGRCEYINKKHLILNPMTHPELARKWLYDNGFEIINDIIIKDGRHFYSVFDAEFTGRKAEYTEADCHLGKIEDFSHREYFVHLLNYLKNKEKGGADCSKVISEIEKRINYDNG